MYHIKEIKDKKQWDDFLKKANLNTFLNSFGWSKFLQIQNHKTFNLGLFNSKKELISTAIAYKTTAKRGTFLTVSHGPQFLKIKKELVKFWIKELKSIAKKEKCDFVRIAPVYSKEEDKQKVFEQLNWKKAPIHVHAEQTVVIDLTQSEKEILMGMRKTTRQMCKKGVKMINAGKIEIEWVDSINDQMLDVYNQTTKRGGFVGFSKKYLTNEYKTFKKYENAKLIVIKKDGKVLSWGMFIISNNRAFYHQGANLLDKDIPAAYIMHWEGIKMTKSLGCISYDFWGVSPQNSKNHPWKSISLFKRGFGGKYVELVNAIDYPLTIKYYFTYLVETIRRIKRGF